MCAFSVLVIHHTGDCHQRVQRSDNTENTKKSILICESNSVHLCVWDHMYPQWIRFHQNILSSAFLNFLTLSIKKKNNKIVPDLIFNSTSIFNTAVKWLTTISNFEFPQTNTQTMAHFDLPADHLTRCLSVKAAQITELLKHLSSSLISILIVKEDRSEGLPTYIHRPLMWQQGLCACDKWAPSALPWPCHPTSNSATPLVSSSEVDLVIPGPLASPLTAELLP